MLLVSDNYHKLSCALLSHHLELDGEAASSTDGPFAAATNFSEKQCDNTTANVDRWSADLAPGLIHRLWIINVYCKLCASSEYLSVGCESRQVR